MSTLERAIVIAAEGHKGVKDKAGGPYILHPLRMMLGLSSPDERIVAVLHDVVEDCSGWTFDRLTLRASAASRPKRPSIIADLSPPGAPRRGSCDCRPSFCESAPYHGKCLLRFHTMCDL